MNDQETSKETQALAKRDEILALAIKEKADPGTLRELMELQERWDANEAKKAFVKAMAAFKAEAPSIISKDGNVDFTSRAGRTHYRHATLGHIIQEITPHLSCNGLSVSWETKQESNAVFVTCNITHEAGHRESTTLCAPRDDSGNKNPIQQIGSSTTYLQRYTLLSALGLATADMDDADDAPKPKPAYANGEAPRRKAQVVEAQYEDVTDYTVCPIGSERIRGKKWSELSKQQRARALGCDELGKEYKDAILNVMDSGELGLITRMEDIGEEARKLAFEKMKATDNIPF